MYLLKQKTIATSKRTKSPNKPWWGKKIKPICPPLVSVSRDQGKRSVNHLIQTLFQSLAEAARGCSRLGLGNLRGWRWQILPGGYKF